LEFGVGATKEENAGKIGYGYFDSGVSLNIVGAGTLNGNRCVRIWDNLAINTDATTSYKLQVGRTANITGQLNTARIVTNGDVLNTGLFYQYATNYTASNKYSTTIQTYTGDGKTYIDNYSLNGEFLFRNAYSTSFPATVNCGTLNCGDINVSSGKNIYVDRAKISGLQTKIWNADDLGVSLPIGSNLYYQLASLVGTGNGGNNSQITLKGWIGGWGSQKVNFDIAFGTRGGINTDGFVHYSADFTATLNYVDIVVGYNSTTDIFYVYLVFKTNNYKSFEFEVGGNGFGGSLVLRDPSNGISVTPATSYNLPNSGTNSLLKEVMVNTSNRNFYYGGAINCTGITLPTTAPSIGTNQIGYKVTGTYSSGAITSNTTRDFATISLPCGVWILTGMPAYSASTSSTGGVYQFGMTTSVSGIPSSICGVQNTINGVDVTRFSFTQSISISTNPTTVYLRGKVTFSGGSLSVHSQTFFEAIRIA